MKEKKIPHVLLGFDFGMRRIGIAIGQTITQTARPLAVLKAQDGVPAWEEIKKLIENWNIDALVVGIPFHMDGQEQNTTYAARRFAQKLKAQFKLPVFWIDERLTSIEAKRELKFSKKSPHEIDSYAAKLILESWLHEADYETNRL